MTGSVHNRQDIIKAAKLLKRGEAITFYNRGVWALIGDGRSNKFNDRVAAIKGAERNNVPIASFMAAERVSRLIDFEKIHPNFHQVLKDHKKMSSWFGSLCFLRLPVKKSAVKGFPVNMLSWLDESTPVFQNWDPTGHKPAEDIVLAMSEIGIKYHAITSLNAHGVPEIISEEEAVAFAKNRDIALVLTDPLNNKKTAGGYTIFSMVNETRLLRHGNIPVEYFKSHFGELLITEGAKLSNHTHNPFPEELLVEKTPEKIRENLLKYLNGK
ncbi:hypothetical protein A2872_01760 [Candidatus Gottesmanbacteria bacterium RIFCSPHIGHO2_01_FULL_42_12]|uniref:YrdC-like domain-containing protein n=1 Tax=Candidatus Gottesmanbacteria bacterium RIFCSPHIGHO2_01_FULL_42_12 TaxID=1798377 RepID=A0A1F5Z5F6_9BACT|nr:MAG: hypothetical protein A2872_01760 [Candidatus Gottesmanbacteria bacterium RIFCSPHIGHO2_01_FULL_42_12]